MRALLLVAVVLAATETATAQNAPRFGFLYNASEWSSLAYDCTVVEAEKLECSFTHPSIRKAATPESVAKSILEAATEFRKGSVQFSEKECKFFGTLRAILDGTEASPDPDKAAEALKSMSDREKTDTRRSIEAFVRFCRVPSESNAKHIAELEGDRSLRTCKVSSQSFRQTFRRVGMSSTWTVVSQPSGDCGVVDLSRFEEAESAPIRFWNYFSRKAITNPSGMSLGVIKCSELDQREYQYRWQAKPIYAGCDYINFTP